LLFSAELNTTETRYSNNSDQPQPSPSELSALNSSIQGESSVSVPLIQDIANNETDSTDSSIEVHNSIETQSTSALSTQEDTRVDNQQQSHSDTNSVDSKSNQILKILCIVVLGMMGVFAVLGIVFLVSGRGAAPEPTKPSSYTNTTEINTALDETEMRSTTLVIPDSSSVTEENFIFSVPSNVLHKNVSRKIDLYEVILNSTSNQEKELIRPKIPKITQTDSTTTDKYLLFADKESMEYLKNVFYPRGRVFSPPRVQKNFLKFFHKSLCDNEPLKTLNISFTKMNSIDSLDELYHMPCPQKVAGFDVSGFIPLHPLLEIFSNVQSLSISDHEMCAVMENQIEILGEPTYYRKQKSLNFLRFSNLSGECKGMYSFFNKFVDLQGISTFVFDESFVSITDLDELGKLYRNLKKLKNLSFKGHLCSSCVLFSRNGTELDLWRSLDVLVFHVPEGTALQGQKSLKNLLPSLRKLKYLDSNVPIPSKGTLRGLKKLNFLRFMKLTINFPDNQTRFSADFFSFFPMLQEAHLKLLFSNTSICVEQSDVQLTNLKKYIGRSELQILTISSNCRITAIKGWSVPCREFESYRDSTTLLHTVSMITCANCSKAGCMR
jgi:hypothetical protein